MRVHFIRRETLEAYGRLNPLARNALEVFLSKVRYADWGVPADIQKMFKDADIIGRGTNRIIFNINGNRYRLICKYVFGSKQVHLFVCWIGTHAEYDFICSTGRQYTINIF